MHINDNIRKARELSGLSQAKIAKLLDEKRSTYAGWEQDIIPRADIFFRLAALLAVNPEELMSENWNPDDKSFRIPVEKSIEGGKRAPNLESIAGDLQNILRQQIHTRAEIRAFGEYQVMKDAQGDKERREAIMEQINKLVSVNLGAGVQRDIHADDGR